MVTKVTEGDCYKDLVLSVDEELVGGTHSSDPV